MRPTFHADGLVRRSTGLTDAHIELIKLLAAKAVNDYLAEVELRRDDVMTREN